MTIQKLFRILFNYLIYKLKKTEQFKNFNKIFVRFINIDILKSELVTTSEFF